jgi:CAAX protease family protein
MDTKTGENNRISSFWTSRQVIAFQIIIVLIPSLIFLKSGNLLLLGVFMGVCFSWVALRLQKLNWTNVGLIKPTSFIRFIIIVIVSTLVIIILSYFLRQLVTEITNEKPNLDAFNSVKGNPKALLLGLLVVWIFGAFGEELLFRGFIINSLFNLLPDKYLNNTTKWALALLFTSIIVSIGHVYQGKTGMILTGIIGFFFGLVYLFSNRNLWASILTHGLYDTVAFIMLFNGFNLDQIFK